MNLKDSTYTYKVDNSTFYQFKKQNGFTEVLEIYKTKSGYGFIFEGEETFKEVSGFKTIALLKNELKNL